MASSDEMELTEFLAQNPLPCFVQVKTSDQPDGPTETEMVYLHKSFNSNCLFAKCYSNALQTYLLYHRPSYVPSDVDATLSLNPSANIKYLFSDIITIPHEYNGLFEVFSSNSIKSDGILDHEKDIASFVTRLQKPKLYYVAKEMKVYEIVPDKRFEDVNNLSRKWTKFSQGCVCKAIRVVSIDYEDTSKSCFNLIKKVLCCNAITKKTDIAIELKLIENLNELTNLMLTNNSNQSVNIQSTSHAQLSKENQIEKTYFLPVYESSRMNEEIDLIPISSLVKNQKLKTNSLQLAKNFASNNKLKDNYIELKLFEENPFRPKSLKQLPPETSELMQENQHLELQKYMSIYDLVDNRLNCKMIVGYSFSKNSLIFIPEEPVDIGLNKKYFYSKLNDATSDYRIENFRANVLPRFVDIAQNEIENFAKKLNKIETFAFKKKNFEGVKIGDIEKYFAKQPNNNKFSITHFADLVNMDSSSSSSNPTECIKLNDFLAENKPKYNTLPHAHSSDRIFRPVVPEVRASLRVKRSARSYSLPIDKALVLKKYLKTKIQDI